MHTVSVPHPQILWLVKSADGKPGEFRVPTIVTKKKICIVSGPTQFKHMLFKS